MMTVEEVFEAMNKAITPETNQILGLFGKCTTRIYGCFAIEEDHIVFDEKNSVYFIMNGILPDVDSTFDPDDDSPVFRLFINIDDEDYKELNYYLEAGYDVYQFIPETGEIRVILSNFQYDEATGEVKIVPEKLKE